MFNVLFNVLYADDSCVAVTSISGSYINILFELAALLEWLNANRLTLNPIRSGLFQTVNDPGGGGRALKAPPPYDLENYCVNFHHIIHVHFTRCFKHVPIGIF